MFTGLRVTIFWNLCLLMVLSTVLINFVQYSIMEREVIRQGALTGRAVFSALSAGTAGMLEREAEAQDLRPKLEEYFNRQIAAGLCAEAALADANNRVVAESGTDGRRMLDADSALALQTGDVVTRLENPYSPGGMRMKGAAPVQAGGREWVLRAVIPLQGLHASMRHSYRMVFLYTLTIAAVLIIVGFLFFTRYLINPMQRLIRQTENIAEENLVGTPLFLSGGNELQKLASALASLSASLKIERGRILQQVRQLEEKNVQLENAQRESLQSDKLASVGRLAAGVAHEVGNPLGIILGYIHLLRSPDITDAERAGYLQRLEHETERIKNTIGDLLNFAQPSSQEVVELSIEEIVRDVCAMISCNREFRAIEIAQDLAAGLPPVRGNDRLVRQMLLNLVLNACDAMHGGGTLTIQTASEGTAGSEKIRLTVADTGHGIAPEHREKIFDPFFTTKDHGTGLGLANVHRIVELMGGSISFRTEPGKGTAFTIVLPAGTA